MPSNIFYSSPKISDDLFLVIYPNFSLMRISFQISLDAPPSAASCPGNDIFLFFFQSFTTFLYQNWPLGCPQGGCPGPSHRPHPPLHVLHYCIIYTKNIIKQRQNGNPEGTSPAIRATYLQATMHMKTENSNAL